MEQTKKLCVEWLRSGVEPNIKTVFETAVNDAIIDIFGNYENAVASHNKHAGTSAQLNSDWHYMTQAAILSAAHKVLSYNDRANLFVHITVPELS